MSSVGTTPRPRFLVVGAGGIGGIVAAHLVDRGHDVTTLTRNALIADAIRDHGFRVRGESSLGTVRGLAVAALPADTRPFDYALFATQPPQVEEAARSVAPYLAPTGQVVLFQNGLCEERVGAIVGDDRVIGAVVAWGASMVEPGVYDRTSAGGFQIGRLDGREDDAVHTLARALEAVGPTTLTKRLRGARWSKLAINCAISSLGTVGGDRLGALMRHRFVRRLALEIMTETVEVARASGVELEKVSGTLDLDWIALSDDERRSVGSPSLLAKHALLLAVGARYRRLRSSMLSAIERGREPAVDFLNGEVASRGAELGIATPINAAIRDHIRAIARREARPSHAELRAFFDRTRPLVAARGTSVHPPSMRPGAATDDGRDMLRAQPAQAPAPRRGTGSPSEAFDDRP
jgi:2-dehydropantoate 2-reductase